MSAEARTLVVPQINVNDEAVRLVSWAVESGARVAAGDVVCTVETSKAAADVLSEHDGIILPIAQTDAMVSIGAPLAIIGPTLDAAQAAKQALSAPAAAAAPSALRATPRAEALALKLGVDLAAVAASGVKGTVKESDVERYAAGRSKTDQPAPAAPGPRVPAAIPAPLQARLKPPEELTRHEMAVIEGLGESLRSVIFTTLDYEVGLDEIAPRIEEAQRAGVKLSLQHVVIAALGRALPKFDRLMSFRAGGRRHVYRQADIAFVVRSLDGRLFTPVVRDAGVLDAAGVAGACSAASMRVNRGNITPDELEGACFTISHIADPAVTRFVALPNRYQSAILAMGGEHAGRTQKVVNLTLSYDHGLCDGSYAAAFLKEVAAHMRQVIA